MNDRLRRFHAPMLKIDVNHPRRHERGIPWPPARPIAPSPGRRVAPAAMTPQPGSTRQQADATHGLTYFEFSLNLCCMSRPIVDRDPFLAIAHPTRRRVLDLLRKGDRPPGELLEHITTSWPTLSHHLRILRNAGLVTERRAGRHRLYTLAPQRLSTVRQWLNRYETRATSTR